jgi:predicted enzyme related to lactoylglutathione lyase
MGTGSAKPKKTKKPKTPAMKNFVSWFEIPASNFARAVAFYNAIYGIEMTTTEMNNYMMAFFPAAKGIGGAVVSGLGATPGDTGTLVYLNGGADLSTVLERVEPAGGRVVMPKTLINEDVGYFALFMDTEGNKLALHSKN